MSSDFVIKLHSVDGGRFKKILEACSGLAGVCETCDWFNPSIQDPMRGHRCHSIGYCPAATLSPKLQSYLWEKLSLPSKTPATEFKHEKVSTLEELDSLEESLVVAGYTWGLDNAWEPESSRSFWHGWRNAQIDRGRIPPDAESTSLARAVVGILNERLTSKS